jgi:hypothetical protein
MSVRRKCAELCYSILTPLDQISSRRRRRRRKTKLSQREKRPRLQASPSISTEADAGDADRFVHAQTYRNMVDDTRTASPDDTVNVAPTDTVTVTVPASLPSVGASFARPHRREWTAKEDAKLIEAVKKCGPNNWVAIAAMVPGRLHNQCRQRWLKNLNPASKIRS